ncbi:MULTISPECIES: hypothetical protein [Sphingomonas]|uniref:Terminase small subunit protein n=1 Tax=Sphingomonas molluscorum TaxID=418184 RepID=A0ABU8Q761_9SPHN|nr:hypothetical protein [Sphingomonas sp. JUb134]MBM7406915.1 hypothetical protein [Sphingomonas sp. JUb134]
MSRAGTNTRARAVQRPGAQPQADTQRLICERLIEGESLRAICRDASMPSKSTVARWLAADEAFQELYARARELQAEALADEILEIADKAHDRDSAAAARVKVDVRKWLASKLAPKKYGDATLLKHADADGAPMSALDSLERVGLLAAALHAIGDKAPKGTKR